MTLRAVIATLAVAALSGGCGSARGPVIYEKAGITAEQKKADEAHCTQAALDQAGPRSAAYLAVDRDVVERCMRARGYHVRAPQ